MNTNLIIKLLFLSFIFLLRELRMHYFWNPLCGSDKEYCEIVSSKERQNEKRSWYGIVNVSLGIMFFVFMFDYLQPTIKELFGGVIIILVGFAITCSARQKLNQSWSNIGECLVEKKELITIGIYSFCRNPLYLGLFIMRVGYFVGVCGLRIAESFTCIFGGTMLIASVVYFYMNIQDEEEYLFSVYGSDYLQYSQRTGRYFPKIFKHSHHPKAI